MDSIEGEKLPHFAQTLKTGAVKECTVQEVGKPWPPWVKLRTTIGC